jgi:hypothetical protein
MKLAPALTLGILHASTILAGWWSVAASAATTANFACTRYEGRLATVIKTKRGNVPVVVWDSNIFANAGYQPLARCQLVTQRFQNFHSSGKLKYLTAGRVRNLPVICATTQASTNCTAQNMLFTLKPGSAPQSVLQQLNNIRNRSASSRVVEESGGGLPQNPSTADSVDMEDWLKFAEE